MLHFAALIVMNNEASLFVTLRQLVVKPEFQTAQNRILFEKLVVSQLVDNSPHYLQPESSLPRSQERRHLFIS
jgi:hypothetical protein